MSMGMSIDVALVELVEEIKLGEDAFFPAAGVDGFYHAGIGVAHQVADLFAVYADMMERAAVSFDAASRVDIATLVKPVRRAAATEECANADFSKAYTALSEARAAGRTDIMAEQSDRMVQSARVASEFDAKEERARQALGVALKKKAAGPTLPADDLIFLADWLGRRKASPEATASAASVFRRLAADMQARSVQLKARGASGAAGPLTQ